MDKIKIMGFLQPPLPTPYPNDSPKFHLKHQKMRKRCKNNFIEAFGAVNGAKKAACKKSWGLQQPHFGGRGLIEL